MGDDETCRDILVLHVCIWGVLKVWDKHAIPSSALEPLLCI